MKTIFTFMFAFFLSMPAFAMDGAVHDDAMMMDKEAVVDTMAKDVMVEKDAVMEKTVEVEEAMESKVSDAKDAMMAKPAVYAVAFHSDNCGSCKVLGPKMGEAVSGFEADDLQVVKFDLTDEVTSAAALATATSHNWTEIYTSNAPKTGFVLLIDGETNEVLAKITKTMSADEIKAEIQKNI